MTDEQRAVLTARFAETRTAVLAREMGVSYRTACRWAAELGLKKSQEFRTGMSAVAKVGFKKRYTEKLPINGRSVFDDEKKAYLRQWFATIPNMVLARELGVNDRTIRRWAQSLGLRKDREVIELHRRCRMSPTPEEWFCIVATIRELYPDGRDEEAAERTGYRKNYVGTIARKYGIERSEEYKRQAKENNHEAIAKMNALRRGTKTPRTLAIEAEVRRSYADTPTPEIARRLGISEIYVGVVANRLGLKKNKDFVRRTRSEIKKQYWNKKKEK